MKSMIAQNRMVASITIRDLDDAVKARLRVRAALRGRSMEDEVRHILRAATSEEAGGVAQRLDLGTAIHSRFRAIGGVELKLPARDMIRRPPGFEK